MQGRGFLQGIPFLIAHKSNIFALLKIGVMVRGVMVV